MKHAHRAGKRVPLAKKSGWRPSSSRSILSRVSIEARKKPRKGPFSRQTEPFSSGKITGGLEVKSSRLLTTSRKREDPVGLNRRWERCGSFNIWTCSGFVVLYSSSTTGGPRRASLRHSLLMSTWWSLFCCVSSSQSLPVLRTIVSKPIIKDTINAPPIIYN